MYESFLFFFNTDGLGAVKRAAVQIKKLNHANNGYRSQKSVMLITVIYQTNSII